jgi:hypothetical protein
MVIKTKLTEQDFIRANFLLFYSKTSTRVISVLFLFPLVINILLFILADKAKVSPGQIILSALICGILPGIIYFASKRGFKRNKINEPIDYQFDEDYVSMKGDSFESKYAWQKVYKVTETKNWLMIWHNSQVANPIHKRYLLPSELDTIKDLVHRKGLKNNF